MVAHYKREHVSIEIGNLIELKKKINKIKKKDGCLQSSHLELKIANEEKKTKPIMNTRDIKRKK